MTYWALRSNESEGRQAIAAIGTNALPFLIDWLYEEPGKLDELLGTVFSHLPASLRPNPWPFGSRRDTAAAALGILGTDAIPAIPDLIRTFDWNWSGGSPPANSSALAEIGIKAIPGLLEALAEDEGRALYVARTISYMSYSQWDHSRNAGELRAVVKALDAIASSEHEKVRLAALEYFWLDDESIQPEILEFWVKRADDPAAVIRRRVPRSLVGFYGWETPQMKLLAKLRVDPDVDVRANAESFIAILEDQYSRPFEITSNSTK